MNAINLLQKFPQKIHKVRVINVNCIKYCIKLNKYFIVTCCYFHEVNYNCTILDSNQHFFTHPAAAAAEVCQLAYTKGGQKQHNQTLLQKRELRENLLVNCIGTTHTHALIRLFHCTFIKYQHTGTKLVEKYQLIILTSHMSNVITYDISKEHDMSIQMVSNDCKKLQVVQSYINKPVLVGNCPYKSK